MSETEQIPETKTANAPGVPAADSGVPAQRVRLRMRRYASDYFTSFVYLCVAFLAAVEFIALFWLDLFD